MINFFLSKNSIIKKILEEEQRNRDSLDLISSNQNEILKSLNFNSTIVDSEWLKYKSFSPGGWAVDNAVLYTLYRVLNDVKPDSIVEFGLGQSSKLIHQYAHYFSNAKATTIEHDTEWVDFFKKSIGDNYSLNIKMVHLQEVLYNGEKTLSFKDMQKEIGDNKFDLILVDAPFGSQRYSRSQVLELIPNNLKDNFCIIIDDYNRLGEKETVNEIKKTLENANIKFKSAIYSGSKQHFLFCSETWKFLVSM